MSELQLDPVATAFVVIDLQKGIVSRETVPHVASAVVQRSAQLLGTVRRVGVLPVLVHVGGAPDYADRLRPSADLPTPTPNLPEDWSDFVPEMQPRPSEVVIFKRQWGAFYGTDLDLQLRRRGIDTIILCGISTELGVESTARFAYEHNYRQIFVEDAMAGFNAESHRNSVDRIFPRIGHVLSTEQVLMLLSA